MVKKVTIVGAGHVGSTTAHRVAEQELADVVLIDIHRDLSLGKALDLSQSGPVQGYDSRLVGSNVYEETEGSTIVIITAGLPRKPGMTRDDLLKANVDIVGGVSQKIAEHSPEAVIIMVTNPLDAMAYAAMKKSGFPSHRVIGMAGILDSARLRALLTRELNVSVENTQALVLGGHGDDMVPLPRFSTVAGIPITELLSPERIEELVGKTRRGGAEIVSLLKQGSAYYAPSAAIVEMVDAILKNKMKILPCSVYLNGEYGVSGQFMGVPAKLGTNGVEEIIEIKLNEEEKKLFYKSAASVKAMTDQIN
ncbi:MAG: malate dehydrogenase [bacterium]